MSRFSSITEVASQVVIPSLGKYADDYDVDAIARAITTYRTDTVTDADGNECELLSSAGYEVVVYGDEFWDVAAANELEVTETASPDADNSQDEPGWGKIKANKTHVYRPDPEGMGYQQRPRGESGDWRPVSSPPPSAVNVAPSVVAAEMGNRCIACGKPLTKPGRSGFGPSCAKKYA